MNPSQKNNDVTGEEENEMLQESAVDADNKNGDVDESKPEVVNPEPEAEAEATEFKVLDDDYIVVDIGEEKFKIPLKLNRPEFTIVRDYQHWVAKVKACAYYLKYQLEEGKITPEIALNSIEKFTKNSSRTLNVDLLRAEIRLLELDIDMRSALDLLNPDISRASAILEEINNLPVTPIMLKKNPHIVRTIRRLKSYAGPNLYDVQFIQNAHVIRRKARDIFNKFQEMFSVPADRIFQEYYNCQRETYVLMTKNLAEDEEAVLVEDPLDFIM